jgi:ribonuclease HI
MTVLLNVLEKRQLSYKVSANSGYGAMGVSKGFLPLMPGAMCVTAKGRQSIEIVAKLIPEKFGGKLVYGDTDSNYVVFPHLKTPKEIWEHAEKVSEEVSKNFPKPMKLEFEGVIYWRFLILTMKRYMSLKCDKEGNVSKKIEKKGVLLSRRDNSNFVRSVYSDIIMKIFDRKNKEDILYDTIQHINKLCAYGFNYKDFIITKSVGALGDGTLIPEPIAGKKGKGQLGNYTVPILSKDPKEKEKQLLQKEAINDKDFYTKCLPAQVQLAEKIRRRGGRVDVGSRLEFLVLTNENAKAKQYDKIESSDYYKEHSHSLKLDYMYYLKALANPLDQVLECTVGEKDFTFKIYKQQILKEKVLIQLKEKFRPKIFFVDDVCVIEKKNDKELFLYTDGASKGNPGKAGAGAVLFDGNGKEITSESKFLGIKTNNEAEYEALLLGIELCQSLNIDTRTVNLRADSQLMVKQLLGNYKARNESIKKLYEKAKKFQFKSIEHVYRENNKRADELSNIGVQSE